jgi:5-methylcytosine-specific restriction protein A
MLELDRVFAEYLPSSEELVAGVKTRRQLFPGTQADIDAVITQRLPELFIKYLGEMGREVSGYRVYGSVGQLNWTLAHIPWVAILRRDITTSTERGYYVVLLFSQNMQSCFLSLNQGFTQFKKAFGEKVGKKKVSEVANIAVQSLSVPNGFIAGRLNLSASTGLGEGYENGAIISREYHATQAVSELQFRADLAILLDLCDQLYAKLGPALSDNLDSLASDDYQESANEIAKHIAAFAFSPGPTLRPVKVMGKGTSKYKRDPAVAAFAIHTAGHRCELEKDHGTFTSRRTKHPFVEAHHLVPMQLQNNFEVSLDVPENIVALCPGCHRKLHHGRFGDYKKSLQKLFLTRESQLAVRGITMNSIALNNIYKGDVDED